MSLKNRLKRLEGPRGPDRCPACNGKLVFVEEHEDGTETYPGGEPCPECWDKPPVEGPGPIRFLVMPCGAEQCAICDEGRGV